jgi:hypothetical protein
MCAERNPEKRFRFCESDEFMVVPLKRFMCWQ